MCWFFSDNFFPLLTILIIVDVIITSIHCDICSYANVTIDISLTQSLLPWCNSSGPKPDCCLVDQYGKVFEAAKPLTFIRYGNETRLSLETKETGRSQISARLYEKPWHSVYFKVLNNSKIRFQVTKDTDGITDIIVPWGWSRLEPTQRVQIKLESKGKYSRTEHLPLYPYSGPYSGVCRQELNFTYNITLEHDCMDNSIIPTTYNPIDISWLHYAYGILATVALVIMILGCTMCSKMNKRSKALPWCKVDLKEGVVAVNKENAVSDNEKFAMLNFDSKRMNLNPSDAAASQSASNMVQTASKTVPTASQNASKTIRTTSQSASKTVQTASQSASRTVQSPSKTIQTASQSASKTVQSPSKTVQTASRTVQTASKPLQAASQSASKTVQTASKTVQTASKPVRATSQSVSKTLQTASKTVQTASNDSKIFLVNLRSSVGGKTFTP